MSIARDAQVLRGDGTETPCEDDDEGDDDNEEEDSKGTFRDITLITTARVPVLNFTHRATSMQFDLCVDHVLPVHNSQLLLTYTLLDPRVRPLMVAIKFWATRRSVKEPSNGGLSSYSFALLVVFFLQVRTTEFWWVSQSHLARLFWFPLLWI